MDIESSSRYSSVWNRNGLGGFIVLRDNKGGVEEDIIETLQPTGEEHQSRSTLTVLLDVRKYIEFELFKQFFLVRIENEL